MMTDPVECYTCDGTGVQPEKKSVHSQYIRPDDPQKCLGHVVEEAGELLSAIGKIIRWGKDSYNPEIPPAERETNREWALREIADLRGALDRYERHLV